MTSILNFCKLSNWFLMTKCLDLWCPPFVNFWLQRYPIKKPHRKWPGWNDNHIGKLLGWKNMDDIKIILFGLLPPNFVSNKTKLMLLDLLNIKTKLIPLKSWSNKPIVRKPKVNSSSFLIHQTIEHKTF
jgi:hypothetical protein